MSKPHSPDSRLSRLARRVEKSLLRHRLASVGQRLLVAVSGGPDSVALLGVLWELRSRWAWELAVAHVHHGLRGQDAEEDLAFVRSMAHDLGLDFLCRRVEPGSLRIPGRSVQEAAREARYQLLEEMAEEFGAQAVALGHQADDQAETVLAAVIRGAGLRGLAAMPYLKGRMVRPMLEVGREEILEYLKEKGMSFRMDPSNKDPRYLRVRIRHELIPLLRSRFHQGIRQVLCRTARLCSLEEEFLDNQARVLWRDMAQKEGGAVCISLAAYRGVPKPLRLRILRFAYGAARGSPRGLGLQHAEAMDELAHQDGQERCLDLPGHMRFLVSGERLLLAEATEFQSRCFCYRVTVPGQTWLPEAALLIEWDLLEVPNGLTEMQQGEFLMDMDKIQGPMFLRSPAPGDKLKPKGLGGSKKLQDLLVDAHVPRRQRWRVPVLADARGVLWVVGHRLDERVSPGPGTRRFLRARVIPATS